MSPALRKAVILTVAALVAGTKGARWSPIRILSTAQVLQMEAA